MAASEWFGRKMWEAAMLCHAHSALLAWFAYIVMTTISHVTYGRRLCELLVRPTVLDSPPSTIRQLHEEDRRGFSILICIMKMNLRVTTQPQESPSLRSTLKEDLSLV